MRSFAIAAALAFAAFVTAKGIPTLRHDWGWPIDSVAVGSFFNESIGGWLPIGFGQFGAHPTTYVIALPLGLAMWLFGPLPALVLFAAAIGYFCTCAAAMVAQRWQCGAPAAIGIGLFALFNPWVYNEVVAGHLVMVLAYAGVIGIFAEMLRGRAASPLRLALWLVLAQSQLQFFIIAMLALAIFAVLTKKWLPPAIGFVLALPSIVGLFAERAAILKTPYGLTWQANQSVAPGALATLGGYFPGYADRLGTAAAIAVWTIAALALAGLVVRWRARSIAMAAAAAAVVFCVVSGVHGPFAAPYEWIVGNVPESGVFRELYDVAGIFAALLAVLACAGASISRALCYVVLAAGIILPAAWFFAPPSNFWVGAASYPHPVVEAPPFTRIALLPAFQPLQLREGPGDGADPDLHAYRGPVAPVNEYLPSFPVDMALARYERGSVDELRALGVAEIVARPWLISRSNGRVGLAASSLTAARSAAAQSMRYVGVPAPLVSTCEKASVVALADRLDACDIFFGDAGGDFAPVSAFRAESGSIDPRSDWIDARLAFAAEPDLAQGVGGVLTQSHVPYRVAAGLPLLAYVRGRLETSGGRTLLASRGEFRWLATPSDAASVTCLGLCELVAQTRALPALPDDAAPGKISALPFRKIFPWLYLVNAADSRARLLRLNERFDAGWIALSGLQILPHVRVDLAANGWLFDNRRENTIILVQLTSLLQIAAEICGIACVAWLLKAVAREPTKRAS